VLQSFSFLFAYFGPEVQLPLLSVLGAASGVLMLLVRSPIRFFGRLWARLTGRRRRGDGAVTQGRGRDGPVIDTGC
jgi:hypothetical protein